MKTIAISKNLGFTPSICRTDDADDRPSVLWFYGDPEKEESDRDLRKANRDNVNRLCNEVELERLPEVMRFDVFDVSSCAVVHFRNNDGLPCYALRVQLVELQGRTALRIPMPS